MTPARRLPALAAATATVCALVTVPATSASAGQDFTVTRPAQTADRFATSASIARLAFPDGVDEAFLVNGDNPVDALAASSVAGTDIPILYTHRDTTPESVRSVLDDLGVQDVYAVGGRAVISDAVMNSLATASREVNRINGDDRYETAYLLATAAADLAETPPTTVILVRGDQLADALSAAPYAASTGTPMLLTMSDHLPDVTWAGLDDILGDSGDLRIVGGPGAISDEVVAEAADLGDGYSRNVGRWYGMDRYQTSLEIARLRTWDPQTTVGLANGISLVDALPGAVFLAQQNAPILLTRPDALGDAATQFFTQYQNMLTGAYALGGTGAIPKKVVDEARTIMLAPPMRFSFGATDTSLRFLPENRSDYRFVLHLAPTPRDTSGAGDPWGYAVGGATWPAEAREVEFAPNDANGMMTVPGLTPGIRYDLWITRTVSDLAPTTEKYSVVTMYSPPAIHSVSSQGGSVTVVLDAPPVDGDMEVGLTTPATNPDGSYLDPRPILLDPQSAIEYMELENRQYVRGRASRAPVEVTFTGLTPGAKYELWARTWSSIPLQQPDGYRQSNWSYWNSANQNWQSQWSPTPTAPSVTVR